jgi:fructokinase
VIDVACIGEVIWDVYEDGRRGSRVLYREPGGASANVAIAVARLGLRAAVAACVGRDQVGSALVARLVEEGLDTRCVERRPERTGVTFIHVGADGEPSFTNYRQGTADRVAPRRVPRAAWIAVGTSAASPWAALRGAGETPVALDLNVRPLLWASRGAAAKEAARLVERSALVKASVNDLEALAKGSGVAWLRRHAPPETACLVTRGAAGVHVRAPGGVSLEVPAQEVAAALDATGAGDAFLAGVLAALVAARARPGGPAFAEPWFWQDAARLGHALGAKAVVRFGATRGLVGLVSARRRVQRIARTWRTRG